MGSERVVIGGCYDGVGISLERDESRIGSEGYKVVF